MPSEDSDQPMKAQADLNLRWAHMSESTFSDVEAQQGRSMQTVMVIFIHGKHLYSRTSMTQKSLGQWKLVLDIGSSSHNLHFHDKIRNLP